jgi:hypothetical protein
MVFPKMFFTEKTTGILLIALKVILVEFVNGFGATDRLFIDLF